MHTCYPSAEGVETGGLSGLNGHSFGESVSGRSCLAGITWRVMEQDPWHPSWGLHAWRHAGGSSASWLAGKQSTWVKNGTQVSTASTGAASKRPESDFGAYFPYTFKHSKTMGKGFHVTDDHYNKALGRAT